MLQIIALTNDQHSNYCPITDDYDPLYVAKLTIIRYIIGLENELSGTWLINS